MTPYIPEILAEINKNPSLLASKYKDNYAVRTLLQYAFDTRLVFNLPEGAPPYTKDSAPIGMSPANFYQQVKKLYVFTRKDLSALRIEQLFIQLLEGIHPSEAEIVIAIKDRKLTDMFPNITPELAVEAGVVEKEYSFRPEKPIKTPKLDIVPKSANKEADTVEAPRRGRGRPKKVKE